jgi:hypothetical protein
MNSKKAELGTCPNPSNEVAWSLIREFYQGQGQGRNQSLAIWSRALNVTQPSCLFQGVLNIFN